MASSSQAQLTLLPGTRALLGAHAAELPQRDDLCGAFCGALALRAAGIESYREGAVDQDTVALAAGSVVCARPDAAHLPLAEQGRRDYRLPPRLIENAALSGTTAAGLLRAVEEISDGALSAIPLTGPWTESTLAGLFGLAAALARPVTLVANLATRHLWGSHPSPGQLLDYLFDGSQEGPPSDWDVGHFVCLIGCVRGPAGNLYAIADTYPSLGRGGVHLQPAERLVLALQRPGMPAGGALVIARAGEAASVRSGIAGLGLDEHVWDNGTVTQETLA